MKGSIALVVLAGLLAGCGLTSSPADGLTFTAPPGWQASPGIMGFMQFWRPASSTDEILMLFRSPKELDRDQVFQSGKLQNTQVEDQRAITICGNQAATFLKGTAESSTGNNNARTPHNVEMTMTNAGGTTYFAMYVYPLKARPNSQAEGALRELCLKR